MDFLTFLLIIFSIFTLAITSAFRARRSSKLPPGPFRFPIIGNLVDLGPIPHQSMTKLCRKYGPLMSLKRGRKFTIIASSPEMAKMVLQKHDFALCGRTVPSTVKNVDHEIHSFVWRPADNQWRNLRKICKEQLFSLHKMDATQDLRRDKIHKLRDYVGECSETGLALDIGRAAFTTTLNLMSSMLFSIELAQFDSDIVQEMKDVLRAVQVAFGTPNLADFFPFLGSIDPQGISKKLKAPWEKLTKISDGIIDQRLKSRGQKNDLLETLINETQLSRDNIKHLLLTLFIAGTDTSASTVEWAMAELLRNPDKMSRLRDEIKGAQVEESDIRNLPYLQAAVKETLRLHPPAPFLLPHKAESEVEINGYLVPKNAEILTNMWAIGRDSSIWTDADVFMPERFLSGGKYEETDFRGKDFELIPFGSGRRICPGFPLAYIMVHLMVATFVGKFEWKLDNGMKPQELDMSEDGGLTVPKAIPLMAIPMKL